MKSLLPVLIIALVTLATSPDAKCMTLSIWRDHPASDNGRPGAAMREGFPIGNGRLGGMVMGSPAHDRFQFNEDSLWTGNASNSETDFNSFGSYQDFGDLFINLNGHEKASGYRCELNLGECGCARYIPSR